MYDINQTSLILEKPEYEDVLITYPYMCIPKPDPNEAPNSEYMKFLEKCPFLKSQKTLIDAIFTQYIMYRDLTKYKGALPINISLIQIKNQFIIFPTTVNLITRLLNTSILLDLLADFLQAPIIVYRQTNCRTYNPHSKNFPFNIALLEFSQLSVGMYIMLFHSSTPNIPTKVQSNQNEPLSKLHLKQLEEYKLVISKLMNIPYKNNMPDLKYIDIDNLDVSEHFIVDIKNACIIRSPNDFPNGGQYIKYIFMRLGVRINNSNIYCLTCHSKNPICFAECNIPKWMCIKCIVKQLKLRSEKYLCPICCKHSLHAELLDLLLLFSSSPLYSLENKIYTDNRNSKQSNNSPRNPFPLSAEINEPNWYKKHS